MKQRQRKKLILKKAAYNDRFIWEFRCWIKEARKMMEALTATEHQRLEGLAYGYQ